jgi:hypothetical protein
MKNIVLVLFTVFLGINIYGQGNRNINRIPQNSGEPTEQEIEKRKRMMEERKNEYINNFITTLEADEFQKEIIKQSLLSFYDKKMVLLKTQYERYFEREQAIKQLEESHFVELKDLISEGDMSKIKEMIKGEFDEKEVKKEKKKKRKKKKKKNKD